MQVRNYKRSAMRLIINAFEFGAKSSDNFDMQNESN